MFNISSNKMSFNLLDNLAGLYKGYVEHVFAKMGHLMKTGRIQIDKTTTNLTITCRSKFKPELTHKFSIKEITPFFNEKKVSIQLDDGRMEERVAFKRSVDDDYWIFSKWLGGMSQTITAYQLKFIDQKLNAFRVQQYNTSNPSKITYFLEISHLEKKEPETVIDTPVTPKPIVSGLKTDWDF